MQEPDRTVSGDHRQDQCGANAGKRVHDNRALQRRIADVKDDEEKNERHQEDGGHNTRTSQPYLQVVMRSAPQTGALVHAFKDGLECTQGQ